MTNLIPCTVQVLTRNSERTIGACLETLRDFAEVLVQDGYSTDRTREIASGFPNVRIIDQNRAFLRDDGGIKDFSGMRNDSIAAARYDWVFVVDGDEEVRRDIVEEVRGIVTRNVPGVYTAFRRFYVNGTKIDWCSGYPAIQIRLFHRSQIVAYRKPVHERLELQPGVTTQLMHAELPVPLPPVTDLTAKYHRYLLMEVKRGGKMPMGRWLYWVLLRHVKTIVGLLLRIAWIWLIPRRGNRMPLAYEWQQIAHAARVIVYTFPPFVRLDQRS